VLCLTYVGLLWRHNQKLHKRRSEIGGLNALDDHQVYRYQY
jgi:hypothetical protein